MAGADQIMYTIIEGIRLKLLMHWFRRFQDVLWTIVTVVMLVAVGLLGGVLSLVAVALLWAAFIIY